MDKVANVFAFMKLSTQIFYKGERYFRNKRLLLLSMFVLISNGSFVMYAVSGFGKIVHVLQYDVKTNDVPKGDGRGKFEITF